MLTELQLLGAAISIMGGVLYGRARQTMEEDRQLHILLPMTMTTMTMTMMVMVMMRLKPCRSQEVEEKKSLYSRDVKAV